MSTEISIKRITAKDFLEKKKKGEKIVVITAYDYPTSMVADQSGVDAILVGDSLGMVVLGYESTLPVTMEDMIHHTKAVVRGTKRALVIGDMPFMSYQVSVEEAVRNAGRFLQEAEAQAVKLEGGREVAETVRRIVKAGIPVMAHIGLTPQSIHQLGGFKVQGRDVETAARLKEDALLLEEAGAFSLVLECIPKSLAKEISDALTIPTIGIGAGVHCDGQVLVFHDLLGLFERFVPKHVKVYANLREKMKEAILQYAREVREGIFPDDDHSFK
ncbi:MAG: 3-methyl-2-oxobutanoate hydroxymethyltransferase [Syntrophales bacterium]|nr:3-methyl-2-oxobutanoate hydroxymethyltransferase [Syntrophales bacterium]